MFYCAKCGDKLTEPGGLAFSPPEQHTVEHQTVEKFHICPPCWGYFLRWLHRNGEPVFPLPPVYANSPAPHQIDPPGTWRPGEFVCTGVPLGGSLTPR